VIEFHLKILMNAAFDHDVVNFFCHEDQINDTLEVSDVSHD